MKVKDKKPLNDFEIKLIEIMKEYMKTPYLHRVEHSFHMWLAQKIGYKQCGMIDGQSVSKLQKEWPTPGPIRKTLQNVHLEDITECKLYTETEGRRGNFDLVMLSDKYFKKERTLKDYINGKWDKNDTTCDWIIEISMDYGIQHLLQDISKFNLSFQQNNLEIRYIIQITRAISETEHVYFSHFHNNHEKVIAENFKNIKFEILADILYTIKNQHHFFAIYKISKNK